MKLSMASARKSVSCSTLLSSEKARKVASPSSVLVLRYITVALAVKILSPGGKGRIIFSSFTI